MNLEGGTNPLYRWPVATKTCEFTMDKISMKMHISYKKLQTKSSIYSQNYELSTMHVIPQESKNRSKRSTNYVHFLNA